LHITVDASASRTFCVRDGDYDKETNVAAWRRFVEGAAGE
jgi:hypothetical protein